VAAADQARREESRFPPKARSICACTAEGLENVTLYVTRHSRFLIASTASCLIINISSIGAARHAENVADGVGKAGVGKLAADMAEELRTYNVACVSLWPRLTKTEDVLDQPDVYDDLTRAASPQFTGRAVAGLAADPVVSEKTGNVLNVLDLAREYGFTDLDGTLPAWDY
jgi:dehydrogenase/reductase SDR family protein 1